jgi:hypothetical protein
LCWTRGRLGAARFASRQQARKARPDTRIEDLQSSRAVGRRYRVGWRMGHAPRSDPAERPPRTPRPTGLALGRGKRDRNRHQGDIRRSRTPRQHRPSGGVPRPGTGVPSRFGWIRVASEAEAGSRRGGLEGRGGRRGVETSRPGCRGANLGGCGRWRGTTSRVAPRGVPLVSFCRRRRAVFAAQRAARHSSRVPTESRRRRKRASGSAS